MMKEKSNVYSRVHNRPCGVPTEIMVDRLAIIINIQS